LRRAMSGKYRSFNEFQSLKDRFFSNCATKGIEDSTTAEVWRQMESFAGYSFCKAHSASFAVESYQSLHLKAYHPLEFMVGVINNFGGFYRTEVYVQEARMAGGTVHAPCVNRSEHLTTAQGTDIYLGFIHVKGLQVDLVEAILMAREEGAFANLADFIARVPSMGHQQAMTLVRVGALRFTGKSKKNLLWELGMHFSKARVHRQATTLFQMEDTNWKIPILMDSEVEDAYDEIELLGFPLLSPFALATVNAVPGEVYAADLLSRHGQQVVIRGYLIATKTVRTIKGDLMGFVDFIDAKGEFFGAVLFPDTYMQNVTPGIGVYKIHGKVIDEYGIPNLEVKSIERMPYRVDPRYDVGRWTAADPFMRLPEETDGTAGLTPAPASTSPPHSAGYTFPGNSQSGLPPHPGNPAFPPR
jgi:error-prone DNA polymerase